MSSPTENPQVQAESKEQQLERNFAQQRKHYERQLEAQKNEFEQRLAQLEQERQAKKEYAHHDDDDSSDEPYVDRKALKKELGRLTETFEKKIDAKAEEKARALLEQERQSQYVRQNPDFREVLTSENIQKFAEKFPNMAEPMLEMPDNFARQKLLYEQIKALGVNKPPAPPQPSMQEMLKNNRKPMYYQPSISGGQPPYAQNGDFSQEGQKAAYAKMKDLLNNRKAL